MLVLELWEVFRSSKVIIQAGGRNAKVGIGVGLENGRRNKRARDKKD
jgi:hypothetical protein